MWPNTEGQTIDAASIATNLGIYDLKKTEVASWKTLNAFRNVWNERYAPKNKPISKEPVTPATSVSC
jgi:hypothetical protein